MDNLAFQIFDSSNNPVTGLSLSFVTYKNQDGVSITPVPILEIGNGFYSFESIFSDANLGFAWLINTGNFPELFDMRILILVVLQVLIRLYFVLLIVLR